jgi:hypothetical protein
VVKYVYHEVHEYHEGFSQPSYIEHGDSNLLFDQRGELPLLPFGNPIGKVPGTSRRALRGDISLSL